MNKPTKEYSAMLYALADEIEAEEGCVTESHEAVREAAQRMDELTVTIRGMEIQRDELLAILEGLSDDIEALIEESHGVAGLHLNGDVAPWGELQAGGEFERLTNLPIARAVIASAKGGAQ